MKLLKSILSLLPLLEMASSSALSKYYNPIIPGWHSDPSCIYVRSHSTFYCATSTFLVTPGIPIYASKDLVNWKLISHAFTRPSQFPIMNTSTDQNSGIFAPTLRYHDGVFYVITVFVFRAAPGGTYGLIFKSKDPYVSEKWSEPTKFQAEGIDPDLFWDEKDGKVYLASTDITIRTVDLDTGATGPSTKIWGGTGGSYPEGPHIYYKDNFYYVLIGEGGTEQNHSVTIARSPSILGPYVSNPANPILTAKDTPAYFQTVGHADLFQDGGGNWWAVALSTRSGPEWLNYPMGRETILTPVKWEKGQWPVIESVQGEMKGWPLPKRNKDIKRGEGGWLGEEDSIDFRPGEELPPQVVTWRWPEPGAWEISPRGKVNTLKLKPSKVITAANGDEDAGLNGLSLLLRLQTDTLFTFNIDVEFEPEKLKEEAGVTVFLTQKQHIDLGIVNLPSGEDGKKLAPHLRLRGVTVASLPYVEPYEDIVKAIPKEWLKGKITLQIQAKSDTHYTFSASSGKDHEKKIVLGSAPATIVSGGSGQFTGSLVGIYATSNNGTGITPSFFSKWRYKGDGQKIDHNRIVPSW